MICRPQRLGEIFLLCDRYRMQVKNLRLVHPYVDREPNMVLTEAVKGARSGLRVAPPLVVYHAPGEYTQEVLHMYNDDNDV